ncbi:MAG: hypothetical protein ACRCU6_02155 [Fusobacteriaceae bacterium]
MRKLKQPEKIEKGVNYKLNWGGKAIYKVLDFLPNWMVEVQNVRTKKTYITSQSSILELK